MPTYRAFFFFFWSSKFIIIILFFFNTILLYKTASMKTQGNSLAFGVICFLIG